MEMMKAYADLVRVINITKGRLELVEHDLKYWLGEDEGHPLFSKGATVYGLATAAERSDRIYERKRALEEQLDHLETIREEIETNINSLEGIEYKIARMRFIEGKDYQKIAEELNISYGWLRQIVSKTNKQRTAFAKTR